ncbi:MAG TPA: response regulator [Burkholderiales bacterium]|nr:response regulator [Burkholderiales bacterium]
MSAPRHSVVVVEDDPQIRRFLRTVLPAEGFDVHEAETGERGLVEAATRKPDLVILDLGLPDLDGVEVVRRLREWSTVPVIILSARAREQDKVAALDAGADDYLTKPFGAGELLARLRVALRHAVSRGQPGEPSFRVGDLEVDLAARRVRLAGAEAHLTPIEYRLLTALVRHAGLVVTHRQLLRDVWGPAYVEHTHTLRVHMAGLRRKIEDEPARPRYLLTELGVGYRLAAE